MHEELARLCDLAEGQYGFVTVPQAARIDVPPDQLEALVADQVAEWVVGGAVLRLRAGGRHPFPRLYALWLECEPETSAWERATASIVASHASALRVHGMGALDGPSAEFTVPAGSMDTPPVSDAAFHMGKLGRGDWQLCEGLPVTTPVHTFLDIVTSGRADLEQLGRIASTTLHKSLATEDELAAALESLTSQGRDGQGASWLQELLASTAETEAPPTVGRYA
jgi:hypothetical protein